MLKKVKHYDFLSIISKGATSLVYKAHDTVKNIDVAIKEVNDYEFYKKEVTIINIINKNVKNHVKNLNIIEYYETFIFEKHGYIVMELLSGNLLDLCKHELSERNLKKIIINIVYALVYLDTLHIVHFDIKPENIGFILKDGQIIIKLFDFGLSETIETINGLYFQSCIKNNSMVKQTYLYRAFHDINHFTGPLSDIWSIGCIVFELFTKTLLFPDVHDEKSLSENIQHVNERMEILFNVPLESIKIDNDLFCFIRDVLISRPCAYDLLYHPYLDTSM